MRVEVVREGGLYPCVDNWALKSSRRRGQGTGRMSYLKTMTRRFKNGFQEGSEAPTRKH